MSGEGTIVINGKPYPVRAGDVVRGPRHSVCSISIIIDNLSFATTRRWNCHALQVFAGLAETREIKGPTNDANAELFMWNVGAAMDHDVDESADCTPIE